MAETTSKRVTKVLNSKGVVRRTYVSNFFSKSTRDTSDIARSAIHTPVLTFIVIILAVLVLRFLLQGRPEPYIPVETGNVELDFENYRDSGFMGKDFALVTFVKGMLDNVPDLTIKIGFTAESWGDWGSAFNWLRNGLYNIFGGLISIVNLWITMFTFMFTIWSFIFGVAFGV